jgi:hypothetical protein
LIKVVRLAGHHVLQGMVMATFRLTRGRLNTHAAEAATLPTERRKIAHDDRLPWRIAAPLLIGISVVAWAMIIFALR